MKSLLFLPVAQVIRMHSAIILLYGGCDGTRDINLLLSALHQPRATFAGQYLHHTIYDMAAAYLFHIIKNHAFIDGNKRTGMLSTVTFLKYNAIQLTMPFLLLENLTVDVANSKFSKKEIAYFFKENSIKTPGSL